MYELHELVDSKCETLSPRSPLNMLSMNTALLLQELTDSCGLEPVTAGFCATDELKTILSCSGVQPSQDVSVERVAFQVHIPATVGSNFGPDSGYLEVLVVFSNSSSVRVSTSD
jgi:hypothetical protein